MSTIPGPWDVLLLLAACVLALAGATWAHFRFWVARIHLPLSYDVVEQMRAPDGGEFELRRIVGRDKTGDHPPVLLVHGICANHRNQDIAPRYSLARYLAERGRDVWLLTLRSGVRRRGLRRRAPMDFRSMVEHDVPLAVRHVLEQARATALDYVAFSMGGMLLYAALGKTIERSAIRKAVFVGSPGRVVPPHRVPRILGRLPRSWVPVLPSGVGARGFAFLSEWLITPLHRMILNPGNMAEGITRLALVDCVEDVPGELLADFIAWATSDGAIRVDGTDVLQGLRQADQPALFIAGAADRIGPASAVRSACDAWGADRVPGNAEFVLMGKRDGAIDDYGHGDLAMGRHVATDLYPRIEAFLDATGGRQISKARPSDQVEAPTLI